MEDRLAAERQGEGGQPAAGHPPVSQRSRTLKVRSLPSAYSCWSCRRFILHTSPAGHALFTIFLWKNAASIGFYALCRRKKDHGRAEAMLIAAWALGLRIQADSGDVIVAPPVEPQEASLDDLLSEEDVGESEGTES